MGVVLIHLRFTAQPLAQVKKSRAREDILVAHLDVIDSSQRRALPAAIAEITKVGRARHSAGHCVGALLAVGAVRAPCWGFESPAGASAPAHEPQ